MTPSFQKTDFLKTLSSDVQIHWEVRLWPLWICHWLTSEWGLNLSPTLLYSLLFTSTFSSQRHFFTSKKTRPCWCCYCLKVVFKIYYHLELVRMNDRVQFIYLKWNWQLRLSENIAHLSTYFAVFLFLLLNHELF